MNMHYVNLPPKNIRPETIERPLWLNSCCIIDAQDEPEEGTLGERLVRELRANEWREEQI